MNEPRKMRNNMRIVLAASLLIVCAAGFFREHAGESSLPHAEDLLFSKGDYGVDASYPSTLNINEIDPL